MSAVAIPPGPRGNVLLGHMFAFRRDPLALFERAAREYPVGVVRLRQGPREVYLVNDPELVKDVLVTHQHAFAKGRGETVGDAGGGLFSRIKSAFS